MSIRQTAVSGQFYPSDPDKIKEMVTKYNQELDRYFKKQDRLSKLTPKAVIVPHAGYIYSGFTANVALRLLRNSTIDTMVVIGPSHRVYLKGTSVSMFDSYATPLGTLTIDIKLAQQLKDRFSLSFVPDAHHEHSTEVQMPLIKAYNPDVSVVELVYGEESPKDIAKIIEYLLELPKTAVVISTDLSHYYDIDKANRLDSICLESIKTLDINRLEEGCEACGKIGIEAMLIAAKHKNLDPLLLDYRTSAEASGDKSSVVGYMSVAFIDKKSVDNTFDNKANVLLKLARASISEAVGKPYDVNLAKLRQENPWLDEKGAAFVTLTTEDENLRGCIGSTVAHRRLYEDVIENARSAAMKDPRFLPVKEKELDKLHVEVSLLTPAKPLEYSSIEDLKSKINVGEDGVILKYGNYQATFLPQVWEQLPTFELFFSHLCNKAGMKEGCLEQKPNISVYQVEKYEE